jgi:tetratricopeptide (TPR) repeat protein
MSLPEKHFQLAEEYSAQGQPNRAIEEFKKVIAVDEKNALAPKALIKVGLLYREKLKDYKEAIASFRKAYKRSVDSSDKILSLKTIAQIYRDDLDDSKAAAEELSTLYKEFGVSFKGGDEVLLEFSRVLRDASNYEEANKKYEEFLEKFPGHKEGPRVMLENANALLSARKYPVAEEKLKEIIEKFKGREEFRGLVAEAEYSLGSLYEEKDDAAKAEEFYLMAKEAYPNPEVMKLKLQGLERRKKERTTQ